ncbi:MAG TPA: hypothetical protein VEB64_03230 [Azospirillaceae bacterium]|nr:hypothetical protein [Azospirillaceae bacterium]
MTAEATILDILTNMNSVISNRPQMAIWFQQAASNVSRSLSASPALTMASLLSLFTGGSSLGSTSAAPADALGGSRLGQQSRSGLLARVG